MIYLRLAIVFLTCCIVLDGHASAFQGKVIYVIDGDTLILHAYQGLKQKIRLTGIDAPEMTQAYGMASKQNLEKLTLGRQVRLESHKQDQDGRTLAKVFVDDKDIGLLQIRDGFAWHYKQYAQEQSPIDQSLYFTAEEQAKFRRSGLWAENKAIPPWQWRHQPSRQHAPALSLTNTCGEKRYCRQMKNCEEARYYYHACQHQRLDKDHDGIPCETLCLNKG